MRRSAGSRRGQRDRSLCELYRHDPPSLSSLLLDPALLTHADPMHARPSPRSKRVATRKRTTVMLGIRDCDARADRVARPQQSAQVGPESHPERSCYEVVPAAVAAPAAATTDLAGSRLVGAQRARATALSSSMRSAYRWPLRSAALSVHRSPLRFTLSLGPRSVCAFARASHSSTRSGRVECRSSFHRLGAALSHSSCGHFSSGATRSAALCRSRFNNQGLDGRQQRQPLTIFARRSRSVTSGPTRRLASFGPSGSASSSSRVVSGTSRDIRRGGDVTRVMRAPTSPCRKRRSGSRQPATPEKPCREKGGNDRRAR